VDAIRTYLNVKNKLNGDCMMKILEIIRKIEHYDELTDEEKQILNNITDEELKELTSVYHMLTDYPD